MIETVMMNANNPQTPGVYTVEKNAFPNSVAQVPTAIPAFVGYTEFAVKGGKPLKTPLLINSMSEYAQHCGGPPINQYPIIDVTPNVTSGPPPKNEKIIPPYDFEINDHYYVIGDASPGNRFYLYNCLELFYQNGGGPCYIMSIGNYTIETKASPTAQYESVPNEPDKDAFLAGLEELPKIQFPKPTMILTPDSLFLEASDYFTVQEQVLMQCGELGDRVGLIDIYNGDQGLESGVISGFRNSIGNNYLKYGISYYPFLETTIVEPKDMTYANVDQDSKAPNAMTLPKIFIGERALPALKSITLDMEHVANLVTTPSLDFGNKLKNALPPAKGDPTGIPYPSWSLAFNAFPASAGPEDILKWQLRVVLSMGWVLYELANNPQGLAQPAIKISNPTLLKSVQSLISPKGNLVSQIVGLYGYDASFSTPLGIINAASLKAKLGYSQTLPSPTPNPYDKGATTGQMFNQADGIIKAVFTTMQKAMTQVHTAARSLLNQYNTALENSNANYKTLMAALAKKDGTLPPSSAMAGVYTLVDNTEGVWNSPANRNINSVIAPTVTINNDQQASLNVDALAGKSINAIRAFFGRGPAIIWGARTLDGNSQDWRYISVRRTMIMIEQSVANAAHSLVFQLNDASTWTTCEAMIDNFLHNLWSEGCLQGPSPAAAYHVAVGLGKTMTPQDILNGIMRVQVKLAIVRPAEFIIITYEQQMAKA